MSQFSESPKKRILISGAGVAGILSAILLDKNLYEIEIIEKADSFRNIGFSITLWKTGFDLLTKIIIENGEYLEEGKDFFRVKGFTLYGGLKLKKLKKLNADGFAWVFERSHLMEILERILLNKINKSNLFYSTTILEIRKEENKTLVKFNDGTNKQYDIVIIAEGINSTTRSLIFSNEEIIIPLEYNLTYEWFSKRTDLQKNGGLFFTHGHIGVIHPPNTKNLLGFYSKNGTTDQARIKFENDILNTIKQPNGLNTEINRQTSHVFELKEVHLPKYHHENIIFIGDAAHGRPPTLGFGTSLAIEDAVLICQTINKLTSLEEFQEKSKLFSTTRIKRIENVYRFQNRIHHFITNNKTKVRFLSFCLYTFYGKYIEYKVKQLASTKQIKTE
jgi:2-polyprenyl-6-methoxyphenol hydroxylase-like FAD-dependent oxidoreductase